MATQLTSKAALPLSSDELAQLPHSGLLGEGATAVVYLAEAQLNRFRAQGMATELALKVARDGFDAVLLREAQALTLAAGPGVPRLYGLGTIDTQLALAMERVEGERLDHYLTRLPNDAGERHALAKDVFAAVGQALMQLHALGWAHHDVKPENIMVSLGQRRSISLIDFGLASDDPLVRSGTPLFLPQGVRSGQAVDSARGDAYALCRTLAGIFDERWYEIEHVPAGLEALPQEWRAILQPILQPDEALWPSVSWMCSVAVDAGLVEPTMHVAPTLRQHYIATRFVELSRLREPFEVTVAGLPGDWCREVGAVFSLCAQLERHQLAGQLATSRQVVADLDAHDRRRFLGRVLGPLAAAWDLPATADGPLVDGLQSLAQTTSLQAITFRQLSEVLHFPDLPLAQASHEQLSACELAFALAERPVSTNTLLQVRALENAPLVLLEEAARVARLTGELSIAQQLVDRCPTEFARLQGAIVLSRKGARRASQQQLCDLAAHAQNQEIRSHAQAYLARYALDSGDIDRARAELARAGQSSTRFEVEALIELAVGDQAAGERAVQRGLGYSHHPEAKARLLGVSGMLHHANGDSSAALTLFSQAVDLARAAGAALEEATYLTGVAAAASDSGQLAYALDASERAEQLFESLGRYDQTARALLARASVLLVLGARTELKMVVERGLALARRGRDSRCEAYLLLCLCDATPAPADKFAHATLAFELLKDGEQDDQLSAATRLLDATGALVEGAESWAISSTNAEVCLRFWQSRAENILRSSSSHHNAEALEILLHLERWAKDSGHALTAGPALVAGAHLALRFGRAESARLLLAQADEIARHLLSHVRPEHLIAARQLSWVEQAQGSRADPKDSGSQLSDVEGLLKALGRRSGFRSLLDQVLDMLLLWTGVERGLLLLRAPGDRLVVRAARNLNRADLTGEQRLLSISVAKRVMDEGRPVILAEAAGDVSNIHRSVLALNLRSVMAVPLIARGEILGVAYLDDRVKKAAFGQRELSWANLISTVAALAIWDERDRLSLRRALRRAERAEQRLAQKLSKNELELELAQRELGRLVDDRQLRGGYESIIGRSRKMRELIALVDRVAQSDVPALIVGESGTGKELVARALADSGPRKKQPFVAENCGAVPEGLLESTLFGHRKGAFSGASRNQPGLFSLAHGGTLFLDEIGEMPLTMQTKLLRVLQDGEVRPLGAERSVKVDVRLVVATHRDLEQMVAAGKFRQDLYFRLNVVRLYVPALRERKEDIPLLVAHFLSRHTDRARTLSDAALARLCSFPWPGNVRQLENEIRRMIVLGGDQLTAADLSPELLAGTSQPGPEAKTLREKIDALERQLVIEALEQYGGNRTRAADALGLSRFGLQKMTQRLNIELDSTLQKSGRIRPRGLDERS